MSDLASVAELLVQEAESLVKRLERSAAKTHGQGTVIVLLKRSKKRNGVQAFSASIRKKSKQTSVKASLKGVTAFEEDQFCTCCTANFGPC